MAVANTKSTEITNSEAIPKVPSRGELLAGAVICASGIVQVLAADDDLSVYRMCRVHSSWVIDSIIRKNDAITGATSYHLGLLKTLEDGGGEVVAGSTNLFGDAIDISAVNLVGVDHRSDAGADEAGVVNMHKRVWELLGLTADPNKWYELAWTSVTNGTGAGNLYTRVHARVETR